MPTTQVIPGSVELQAIADTLGKSRKVVVVTGAGISTNCGIPDFRSENGLYSLIQAQFDAAAKNPPWEETNTHDIDDRAKKRRKPWYFYEVVAPSGQVVDTVGGGVPEDSKSIADVTSSKSTSNRSSRSRSASAITNPPTNFRVNPSDSSDLSDPPSDLGEAPWSSGNSNITERLSSENQNPPRSRFGSPTNSRTQSNPSDSSDLSDPPSDIGEALWSGSDSRYPRNQIPRSRLDSHSQSQTNSLNDPSDSSDLSAPPSDTGEAPWITSETQAASPKTDSFQIQNPRRSSRRHPDLFTNSTSIDTLDSRLELLQPPSSAYGNTTSSFNTFSINNTASSDATVNNINPTPQRRSRPRSLTPTRQSLPSSSAFQLPELQPAPSSRSIQVLRREESSFVSNNSEEAEPSTQSSQSSRTSLPNLKGRDLFDSMVVWSDPFTTSIFYMFISSLRQKIYEVRETTETHKFIKVLRDGGRLVRNYTQNIDCLEEREGLVTEISSGPGNRSRFTPKTQREPRPAEISRDSAHFGGVEVVLLHGSLGALRCGICSRLSEWDAERGSITIEGRAPDCPSCLEAHAKRTRGGRRGLAVGRLRPDIVLYGEEHPQAALVSPLITHDLGLGPDVLLIMGTSLRVHGLKVMVREFAKAIHAKGGKVVFVNRTKPSESVWGEVIDYWVEWDCDEWVVDLRERRGDIWLPQGSVEDRRESVGDVKSRRSGDLDPTQPKKKKYEAPRCTRDEKTNGVYFTFKIMDTLRSLEDKDGQSARRQYWVPRSSAGFSNAKSKTTELLSIKASSKTIGTEPSTLKAPRKSLPDKPQHMKTTLPSNPTRPTKRAPRSNKRKSMLAPAPAISEDQTRVNFELTKQAAWHELRTDNPSLPKSPPEISHAILQQHADIPWLKAPNVDWKAFPTLLTHPPFGESKPVHTPSRVPTHNTYAAPTSRPPPNHSYGTRASRNEEPPAPTMMDGVSQPLKPFGQSAMSLHTSIESRIPTPPESDPQTPVTNRDMSVGAMLSSEKDDNDSFKSVTGSVRESTLDSVDMLCAEKDGNESFNSAKDQDIKWHDAVMEQ